MSHCSQCGRYVGPYEACPYCGARITGRIPIRAMKAAALVMASVGLVVLWLVATRSEVPLVEIGQAGATMNMAYARVEGWVVRGPTYYADSGYLALTLADDTGEIRVSAYSNEVEGLRALGQIPALGDRVSVAGTLRVREEGVALTINVPEHVEILRPAAVEREIGSITASDRLLRVRVRGQVWAVRQPRDGLTLVTLRDRSGAIDLVVDREREALSGAFLPLQAGQSVEVVAAVDLYGETPQLVPASVMDVALVPEEIPVATLETLGALSARDAGRMVAVQGTVVEMTPFSAGVKFTLDDGWGSVTVVLWHDLAQALAGPQMPAPGRLVQVVGEVSVYRDELELIPERPVDVKLLEAGVPSADEGRPSRVPIGELTVERAGEAVTVEGAVVEVSSFSSGFRFTLDDGSGQTVLLLWLPVYDALADPAGLDLGAELRAAGTVETHQGVLQVVPVSGSDVGVLAPGEARASLCQLGALSGEDAGSLVAVEGVVTQAESFSGGRRLRLSDGTGEMTVLLWENVYQRVPDRVGLRVGGWVRVVGVVEEYLGALEVVARLPHDVTVANDE